MSANWRDEMTDLGRRVENHDISEPIFNSNVARMMQKMGYKEGSGLGKDGQGIKETIDVNYQMGRACLGNNNLKTLRKTIATTKITSWDFSEDEVTVKEEVTWLENEVNCNGISQISLKDMTKWIKEGKRTNKVMSESKFCDLEIYKDVLKAKGIFDELNNFDLCVARAKANPFETIKSIFFMNRAALKIANIDAATNFIFTKIDENEYFKDQPGPFYFADVCAGPGGFTEYMLWRKKWMFKGFGLTYKDENDFNLEDSQCNLPSSFQKLYGHDGDGNVCSPLNISDFRDKVRKETDGEGVHFMMSDGGFSVEGCEDLQEVLSKQIYVCQCLVALEVVRNHGLFVTKLFDLFTPFSVGLLYLMYQCFEKVTILKPNTSRPANSERYFVCANLKKNNTYEIIKKYLWIVVVKLWDMQNTSEDVIEIVPLRVMKRDEAFFNYIFDSNNRLGTKQIAALKKMASFCQNPTLFDPRQEKLREECLQYWNIPDQPKASILKVHPHDFLSTTDKAVYFLVQPREVATMENLTVSLTDVNDWHYCPMYGSYDSKKCYIFAGVGCSKVLKLQNYKWVKDNNIDLCRGTMLYGEIVPERVFLDDGNEGIRHSLHVIDALRLGDKDLRDLPFSERWKMIQVYCKSINKESQGGRTFRVRPKPMEKLSSIVTTSVLDQGSGVYRILLPVLGHQADSESFHVKSLMLLKTNEGHSFFSTFILRVQVQISGEKCLPLQDIITEVKNKL